MTQEDTPSWTGSSSRFANWNGPTFLRATTPAGTSAVNHTKDQLALLVDGMDRGDVTGNHTNPREYTPCSRPR